MCLSQAATKRDLPLILIESQQSTGPGFSGDLSPVSLFGSSCWKDGPFLSHGGVDQLWSVAIGNPRYCPNSTVLLDHAMLRKRVWERKIVAAKDRLPFCPAAPQTAET